MGVVRRLIKLQLRSLEGKDITSVDLLDALGPYWGKKDVDKVL